MLKDKLQYITGILVIVAGVCALVFVGMAFTYLIFYAGQSSCVIKQVVAEDSYLSNSLKIAQSKISPLPPETALSVETPLIADYTPPEPVLELTDTNKFPTQERLEEIYDEIYNVAMDNNFNDVQLLYELVDCESDFRTHVVNTVGGERGLYQFHPKWHPEISDECSFSIDCATREAIKILREKGQYEWACGYLIEDWL